MFLERPLGDRQCTYMLRQWHRYCDLLELYLRVLVWITYWLYPVTKIEIASIIYIFTWSTTFGLFDFRKKDLKDKGRQNTRGPCMAIMPIQVIIIQLLSQRFSKYFIFLIPMTKFDPTLAPKVHDLTKLESTKHWNDPILIHILPTWPCCS